MGEVVDGDPAHVHARLAQDEGDEVLLAAGEGVEDPERHHGTSTLTTAMAAMPSPRPRRPRRTGLDTPLARGSVLGDMRPRSARGRAPRRASPTACGKTSASEGPPSPRED